MTNHGHWIGGKCRSAPDRPPRTAVTERVITDEEAVWLIIADWDRERAVKFALGILGDRARAWWARIEEHQS